MTVRHHVQGIKQLFFLRWDRQNLWRVSTTSKRHVHGRCDPERRVIEIVVQHADPDERDKLIIHEVNHAVAGGGHGKKWQDRMEKAAKRAVTLGRPRLARLLREEIVGYQQAPNSLEVVYNEIRDALTDCPDATFAQIKRWLGKQYGLLLPEVCKKFRRAEKVYEEAKREAQEGRAFKEAFVKSKKQVTGAPELGHTE